MRNRRACKQSFTIYLLATPFSFPLSAIAAIDTWDAPSDGNFTTGPWFPALPGPADLANFNQNGTYAVTFDTSLQNTDCLVSNGAVTWLTNGTPRNYTLSDGADIIGGSLTLASSAAPLNVTATTMSVNGAGAPLLNVAGTNTFTSSNLSIGNDGVSGHSGTVTVSSLITLSGSGTLTVGASANSTGNVTITAGAFIAGAGMTTVNATGSINISGGNFAANGDLTFNGGALNQNTGAFDWNASHNMTIQSGGKVNLTGIYTTPGSANITLTGAGSQLNDTNSPSAGPADLDIDSGSQLTVNSGASVSSSFAFEIGANSNGTAIFDGANTSLSVVNTTNYIGHVGTSSLTFRNNASASIGGLIIGPNTGANGSLNIQSGANVSLGITSIAQSGGTGSINVSGGTLTQPGFSTLTIGSPVPGNGSINVSGGSFSTGTGVTTVYAGGLINISGGTFTANGDITFTGGNLTQTAGTFAWAPSHTMTIQSGGKVNLTGVFNTPANAIITVTGPGSQFNASNSTNLRINNGAQLTFNSGASALISGFLIIASAGDGTVIFDGANTSLSGVFGGSSIGSSGTGSLTFRNNAVASAGGFTIGFNPGSNGSLNIQSGANVSLGPTSVATNPASCIGSINFSGGTLTQPGFYAFTVGAASSSNGSINVSGGSFNTGTGPMTVNATGSINLSGGSFNVNGDLAFAGGTFTQTAGTVSWVAAHNMTIQSGGHVSLLNSFTMPDNANITVAGSGSQLNDSGTTADLILSNGTQLSVTGGASVSSSGFFEVARNGNGTAIFDGANTSLSVVNPLGFIARNGTGSLTIRNNAVASIGGYVIGFFAGSNGALNVQSGANVSLGNTSIATNAASTTGSINISGGTLTQPGAGGFSVGAASASNGSINVTGGSFSTGTSTTTVFPTGSINISAGSFTINGPLTNSGLFNSTATLNVNANITNTAAFSQSGPQSWSQGATFTNSSGNATFGSNAKLYGLTITRGAVNITSSKLIIEPTNKSATLSALRSNLATHSLISSTLPKNFGLALLDNAITHFTTFGGNPVDANSLLIAPELLGDANDDGNVGLADLDTVLSNFGNATPNWTDGNFDNATTIDLTDLADVLNNFGLSNPNASAAAIASAPEPASLAFLFPAALLLRRKR